MTKAQAIDLQAARCAAAPREPRHWARLAQLCLQADRAAEAVAAAERALALAPSLKSAVAARTAAVKLLEACDPGLAVMELTAAARPHDPELQLGLGRLYLDLDRPADAERYLKRALALDPDMPGALASLGVAYLSVGIDDGAEHYSRRALEVAPGHAVASQTLATLLEKRGETESAETLLDLAYDRQSIFLEPAANPRATVLILATRTNGNVPYRHILPPNQYTRFVWFMEHAGEDQFDTFPPYDLVFNTIGEPDRAPASSRIVEKFLAHTDRPVLNDPSHVARTRRDRLGDLLAPVEDAVTPKTVRLSGEAIARHGLVKAVADAGLSTPVLVRPIGSHGGMDLERAQDEAALEALSPLFAGFDAYVTQYVDYSSADGCFRKGRMIFIDRKPHPYHWAVSEHWLVHYKSANMGRDPRYRAEELQFLEAPADLIGARAMGAIEEIGRRLDLDYCGLDFSVMPDGRLLVFEANATMLVHPEVPGSPFGYKNPAVTGIVGAFQQLVAERIAG